MQLSIHYYTQAAQNLLSPNCNIYLLAADCQFSEGPMWHSDGFYLFSDIPANCIYKVNDKGLKEKWLYPSGFTGTEKERKLLSDQIGSNGLAQTKSGEVLICQHGNGAIGTSYGNVAQALITGYKGKRLNSPNDLTVGQNETVYFTDPPYGLKDAQLHPDKAQAAAGVYCWKNGELKLFCTDYAYPNGICLSADEQTLYVCSNKPFEKFITVFDAPTLAKRKILAAEASDGMKCDGRGQLWLCTKEGVVLINEQSGERQLLIELPKVPANIAFGGKTHNEALVTARENIFMFKNLWT